MSYIEVSDIRSSSGISSSLVSDTQVEHAISIVEPLVEKYFNTKFKPTLRIDILDGNNNNRIHTNKNPLLRVEELISNDTNLDVSLIDLNKPSGEISLNADNSESIFVLKRNTVKVKYRFGLLSKDEDTQTETTAETTTGSSVTISVSDGSDFAVNDWIDIIGTDGNQEVAKITAIDSNDLTVDKLTREHESGSIVTKLEIPYYIKRFMELEAQIYIGINAIGGTYEFNAGYTLGDLSVQKGVPYTHFTNLVTKSVQERNTLTKFIKQRVIIR